MPDVQAATGTTPDERPFWIAFSHVPGIGPARFASLLQRFGSARAAWQAPERHVVPVLDARSREAFSAMRRDGSPERMAAAVERCGAITLTWDDETYPAQLRQIALPPFVLYIRGDAALLMERAVAIVGTRQPTPDGRRAAREIAGNLAARGLVVVSGLARGIDAEAHLAALDTGRTVAVLGTGPEAVYPAENRKLQRSIAVAGALVTEYPPGSSPEPGNFLARNRIISGLALATIVVEAGDQSGALVTAHQAAEQGRDVLAVPGSIYAPQSIGTNRLLSDGAGVCRGAADVLTALQLPLAGAAEPPRAAVTDPVALAVLSTLHAGAQHIDDVARAARLPVADVTRALAALELSGHVEHLGQMQWASR